LRLVVVPKNGLANRMRAIEAGAAFCARHGYPYRVDWWRDWDCNEAFFSLFEAPSRFPVRERPFSPGRIGSASMRLIRAAYLARGYQWIDDEDVLWWDHQSGRERLAPWRRIVADSRPLSDRCRGLVLHTHRAFEPPASGTPLLEPSRSLLAESRAILAQGCRPAGSCYWIGVHIRRADHARAKRHSPTGAFIDAIDRRLARHPDALLFLATDSPEEESALRHRYGAKLVTADKQHWQRTTPAGVRAAMIDLLCLSLCDLILGSYWSSFSETAARLCNVEMEVVWARD